jgi:hypothetical protein
MKVDVHESPCRFFLGFQDNPSGSSLVSVATTSKTTHSTKGFPSRSVPLPYGDGRVHECPAPRPARLDQPPQSPPRRIVTVHPHSKGARGPRSDVAGSSRTRARTNPSEPSPAAVCLSLLPLVAAGWIPLLYLSTPPSRVPASRHGKGGRHRGSAGPASERSLDQVSGRHGVRQGRHRHRLRYAPRGIPRPPGSFAPRPLP